LSDLQNFYIKQDKAYYIGRKSRFFMAHLHSTPPLRWRRRNDGISRVNQI